MSSAKLTISVRYALLGTIFLLIVVGLQFLFVTRAGSDTAWGPPFYTYMQTVSEGYPFGYMVLQQSPLSHQLTAQMSPFALLSVHGLVGNMLFWICMLFFKRTLLQRRFEILREVGFMLIGLPFFFFVLTIPNYFTGFDSYKDLFMSTGLWVCTISVLVAAALLAPLHLLRERPKTVVRYFLGFSFGMIAIAYLLLPVYPYAKIYTVVASIVWPILFLMKIWYLFRRTETSSERVSEWQPFLPVIFILLLMLISGLVGFGQAFEEELRCIGEGSSCNG